MIGQGIYENRKIHIVHERIGESKGRFHKTTLQGMKADDGRGSPGICTRIESIAAKG